MMINNTCCNYISIFSRPEAIGQPNNRRNYKRMGKILYYS